MNVVTLSTLKADQLGDVAAARPLDAWPTDVTRAYLLRAVDGSGAAVLLCFCDRSPAEAAEAVESAARSHAGPAEQTFEVITEFRVQEWRSAEAAMRAGLV